MVDDSDASDSEIHVEVDESVIKFLNGPKKLEYATVRFDRFEKNKLYQVPIADIKVKVKNATTGRISRIPFKPDHENHFVATFLYDVKWYCSENCTEDHDRHYSYHKAAIINLGTNEQDCILKASQKRCQFKAAMSTISDTTESSTSTVNQEKNLESLVEINNSKQLTKLAQKAAAQNILMKKNELLDNFVNKRKRLDNSIENMYKLKGIDRTDKNIAIRKPILKNIDNLQQDAASQKLVLQDLYPDALSDVENHSKNVPSTLSANNIRSEEQENFEAAFELMKHPDKTPCKPLHSTNVMDVNGEGSPVSSCKTSDSLDDENSTASAEPTHKPDNQREPLIEAILKSHQRRPKKIQYIMPPEKLKLDTEGSIYDKVNDDNQIYLGLDIYVDVDVWAKMNRNKKRPTVFVRDLAEVIWQPHNLVMRAFDVSLCTATTPGITDGRQPFEEDKWQLLITLYTKYLNDLHKENPKVDVDAFLNKVSDNIRSKIQDLRQTLRRAEERKTYGIKRNQQRPKKSYKYIKHHQSR